VAPRAAKRTTRRRAKSAAAAIRVPRLRLLALAALAAISVYLYYRPLASYFETRSDLAQARSEVETLRAAKQRLEQRLAFSTSLEATRREARRIGYVRPGEQLFIVKGIPGWRKAHRTVRGDG
jgi:cell division protein FtsB